MAKRPKAHEIDTEAKNIFTSALPSAWVAREEHKDYGIDFVVEVFEHEQTTGIRFGVQLKGKRRHRFVHKPRRSVSVSIPTHNLGDYVDTCRFAVFLFAVDVTSKKGYWQFLQEYALKSLAGRSWRSQKSISIRIDPRNQLTNINALIDAVRGADKYMSGLHPAAVPSAIKAHELRLQSLDERFDVEIVATEGSTQTRLSPREDPVNVQLCFQSKGHALKEQLHSLLDLGLPTTFEPGQIMVDRSPLLNYLLSKATIVHARRRIEASVSLNTKSASGLTSHMLLSHGAFEGGTQEMRFVSPTGYPLSLDMRITAPRGKCKNSRKARIKLKLDSWEGIRLLSLPYFDQVDSMCGSLCSGEHLVLSFLSEGNKLFEAAGFGSDLKMFRSLERVLKPIRQLRRIAAHFGVNPLFAWDELDDESVSNTDFVHWTLFDGTERPNPGWILTTRMTGRVNIDALSIGSGSLELVNKNGNFIFLGETVPLELRSWLFSEMSPDPSIEELRNVLQERSARDVEIRWRPARNSTIIANPEVAPQSATEQ